MLNPKIPEKEVENILSVYWQMVRELENHAQKDVYIRHIVDGGYKVLNRCGVTDAKPSY